MYEYEATVLGVTDGDTVKLDIDLGCDTFIQKSVRFFGIDAPEKNTEAGKQSKLWMESTLQPGTEVVIKTIKDKKEKYGRYLGIIITREGLNLNEEMVRLGLARSYDGGKR